MRLTQKQEKVIQFIVDGRGEITISEAVTLIGDQYHNQSKYVGETLSRMVRRGVLCRVRRGVYKLATKVSGKKDTYVVSPSQTRLFEQVEAAS
ncbi:hypothetical protein DN752_19535 [Echinicola strongylocentroti]|uniref:AbiEi antitoxin N-terminal domain-containing protein n=1 Tax=Echinicola strongylocentroti TaxID=1795355 RepID=A0A2Z4IMM7_9BACT|nr:type IV toxin-antitoxin system AbiEi family antitoxin domain-containing protein [Echinicola strongylocentroti]AWW32155.1 hypothetical protein DN752_19535 [Echinicola strongylocentroti]